MITRTHQMGGKQLADLELLMDACKTVDHNTLPIYKHLIDKRHTLPCNTLYYDNGYLIGYLRTFFFYANTCEIALMVDPKHRRLGVARALLTEILPIVLQERMTSLIFSTPKDLHKSWFSSLGMNYRGSELQMQYDPQKPTAIAYKPAQIRLATINDIPTLIELDNICFPNKKEDPEDLFRNLLITNNCAVFVLVQDNRILGKAHVFKESDRARITDIGVYPNYRGQGFASALIKYCINHALINNKPKIVLDVETTNESALTLYEGLGFSITNAHDYWITQENKPDYGLSTFLHSSLGSKPSDSDRPNKDAP